MIEILYNIDFDALSEGSGKIQAGRGHALFSLDRKVLGQFKYSFAHRFEIREGFLLCKEAPGVIHGDQS